MYCVSYFCAVGNPAKENQDRVLVNGDLLQDGIRHINRVERLSCFVADGVGSEINSGNAAEFVMEALRNISANDAFCNREALRELLSKTNHELVLQNHQPGPLMDSATTLCGIVHSSSGLHTINVGDSEVLITKDSALILITEPQVLDREMKNSPITSYLGGRKENMFPAWGLQDDLLADADLIILSTDGLRKAISEEALIHVLSTDQSLQQRSETLFSSLCSKPVPDNLGVVLIERLRGDK